MPLPLRGPGTSDTSGSAVRIQTAIQALSWHSGHDTGTTIIYCVMNDHDLFYLFHYFILWILVRFVTTEPQRELPDCDFNPKI